MWRPHLSRGQSGRLIAWVCDCEQHVGTTRFAERTPTRQVQARKFTSDIGGSEAQFATLIIRHSRRKARHNTGPRLLRVDHEGIAPLRRAIRDDSRAP